jgi:hypothetical protein
MSERRRSGNWFALLGLLAALASACGGTVPGGGDLPAEADPDVTLTTQETTTSPAWKAGTNYAVGAVVTYNGITYECRQAHRSLPGWEPPRALSLWQRPTPAGLAPWTTQTHYLPGSEVTFAGQTWVCRREHVSQIDWLPGKTPSLWALPNRPPVITILAPAPSSQHLPTAGVVLLASVEDPDGPSPFSGTVDWTSDLDGPLCGGLQCSSAPLRVGAHLITARATDAGGASGTATVRIVVNTPPSPTIVLPPEGAAFFAGQPVTFSGSASDPEQEIPASVLSWSSHIDGALGSGPELDLATLSPGTHRITLTASDDFGAIGAATVAIIVSPLYGPPSAIIQEPPHGSTVLAGTPVHMVGLGFDPEDGLLPDASLVWSSDLDGSLGTGPTLDVALSGPATCAEGARVHRVTLTVTDSDGNTASYQIAVQVVIAC